MGRALPGLFSSLLLTCSLFLNFQIFRQGKIYSMLIQRTSLDTGTDQKLDLYLFLDPFPSLLFAVPHLLGIEARLIPTRNGDQGSIVVVRGVFYPNNVAAGPVEMSQEILHCHSQQRMPQPSVLNFLCLHRIYQSLYYFISF